MAECSYVADASRGLLKEGFHPAAIQNALGVLGRGAQVDRVYIFEDEESGVGEPLTTQRYEWVAPGIVPQIDDPACQNLPYSTFGKARADALRRGEVVVTLTRETQPLEFRQILASQGVRSLLLCPIVYAGKTWGFVGFDDCHSERRWPPTEVNALQAFARAMAATLRQAALRQALDRARGELRRIL
jgi:GAF domain-containing protein